MFGGAIFIFRAQINLKTAKTCYFAYFSGQWGGAIAPFTPPPPSLATLLVWTTKHECAYTVCVNVSKKSVCIFRTYKKRTKNGYCVNPPLIVHYFHRNRLPFISSVAVCRSLKLRLSLHFGFGLFKQAITI